MTTRQELAKAVISLLDKGINKKKVARAVAAYLLTERRTSELEPLLRQIQNLRAERGVLEATTVSARKLNYAVKERIKELLKKQVKNQGKIAKRVILNEIIEPSVIGGVRISYDDLDLDITIRSKLKRLTQSVQM